MAWGLYRATNWVRWLTVVLLLLAVILAVPTLPAVLTSSDLRLVLVFTQMLVVYVGSIITLTFSRPVREYFAKCR